MLSFMTSLHTLKQEVEQLENAYIIDWLTSVSTTAEYATQSHFTSHNSQIHNQIHNNRLKLWIILYPVTILIITSCWMEQIS
jgi:hypothetical protein